MEPKYVLVWKSCDYSGSLYMSLVTEAEAQIHNLERVTKELRW